MKKEIFYLEKGMFGIREVHETYPSLSNEEEFVINARYATLTKSEIK